MVSGADFIAAAWKAIGVEATQVKLNIKDWGAALENGNFTVAIDFDGDYFDDPILQLGKYVSRDLSPSNYSNSTDRFLDALYIGEAITTDPRERVKIVRDFEKKALTEAYTVPILWWSRIVATSMRVQGWGMSPSHYIGQDLTDVWLDTNKYRRATGGAPVARAPCKASEFSLPARGRSLRLSATSDHFAPQA